jgi:hypothetical protein
VLLQPVPCSRRFTAALPVAVLSVTLEGQSTSSPKSAMAGPKGAAVLPITVLPWPTLI